MWPWPKQSLTPSVPKKTSIPVGQPRTHREKIFVLLQYANPAGNFWFNHFRMLNPGFGIKPCAPRPVKTTWSFDRHLSTTKRYQPWTWTTGVTIVSQKWPDEILSFDLFDVLAISLLLMIPTLTTIFFMPGCPSCSWPDVKMQSDTWPIFLDSLNWFDVPC